MAEYLILLRLYSGYTAIDVFPALKLLELHLAVKSSEAVSLISRLGRSGIYPFVILINYSKLNRIYYSIGCKCTFDREALARGKLLGIRGICSDAYTFFNNELLLNSLYRLSSNVGRSSHIICAWAKCICIYQFRRS